MKIYHNPRCRKSREALAILESSNQNVEVVEYLKTPLNAKEIGELLKLLNAKAEDIVRKEEALYKENFKNKTLSETEWIDILAQNPILIQRPIVTNGKSAVIARPPETLKALF